MSPASRVHPAAGRSFQGFVLALALAAGIAASGAAGADPNPDRNAYFGETHVHTTYSLDAYLACGITTGGPEDFYRYATGHPVVRPGGDTLKITTPLDWGAVTEHAEYLGAMNAANDPDAPLSHTALGKSLQFGDWANAMATYKVLAVTMIKNHPIKELMAPEVLGTYWKRIVETADEYYEPGKFTTFAAYEWTSTPNTSNLHRNIIFLDTKKVPDLPFSAINSVDPRDLWAWMDTQRAAGHELLAISHNANLSNGLMFPTETDENGRPIDKAWAESRLRNEPLSELKQVKGQSETSPALSPNDEFADYEVFRWQLLGAKGAPKDRGSYIRQAFKDGLAMRDVLGINPYRFGIVGGSDVHDLGVPYRQKNYFGAHGVPDDTAEKRLTGNALGMKNVWPSPAGLSAVWAEENTRESIFAALKRKETYATSGVRIKVRLFGGWDFAEGSLDQGDWIKKAYATGTPMGGELPAPAARAPGFLVWAIKDPDSANLDRIQIVKGWSKHGQTFEKVYDVAWSGDRSPDPVTGKVPPVGNTVDVLRGTYEDSIGTAELKTVWTDPDFDPGVDAFYYARVLEIPTPRWSTIQAVKLGLVPPSGPGFQPVIQERAWTSPLWYTASAEARAKVDGGLTSADLLKQGAVALDQAQLEAMIVGKTIEIRNTVTGKRFQILHGADGRRLITSVDGETPDQDIMGELSHGSEITYKIEDGRYEVEIAGAPVEITVYRLGDKYYAARSNEFGYANYELTPEG